MVTAGALKGIGPFSGRSFRTIMTLGALLVVIVCVLIKVLMHVSVCLIKIVAKFCNKESKDDVS